MFGCVLSQLKPSEFYILRFEKPKNVEVLELYPIHNIANIISQIRTHWLLRSSFFLQITVYFSVAA